ncbi:MAG TPA: fasciclin domain-containing protein [Limnobacter sp.]|nr:fasciclin domain-containing protein [Limnobacter sp.]
MMRKHAAKTALLASLTLPAIAFTMQVHASTVVGGAEMSPNKTIVENAIRSQDHTTLVSAVQAAGLGDTLQSKGPFTVFAPTNAAFDALPNGTVEQLLQPDNRDSLRGVLTYHVVPGKITSNALTQKIVQAGGLTELETVAGDRLKAFMEGGKVVLEDSKGKRSTVTIADVNQANGVIHVIDGVLLPGKA